MGITSTTDGAGITTVTVDFPPVNALPSAAWFELADAVLAAGKDMNTHVVVLRAEGRGFNAGVDIKEMQATEGFDALIAANHAAPPHSPPCTTARSPSSSPSTASASAAESASWATRMSSSRPTTRCSVSPRSTAVHWEPRPICRDLYRNT